MSDQHPDEIQCQAITFKGQVGPTRCAKDAVWACYRDGWPANDGVIFLCKTHVDWSNCVLEDVPLTSMTDEWLRTVVDMFEQRSREVRLRSTLQRLGRAWRPSWLIAGGRE